MSRPATPAEAALLEALVGIEGEPAVSTVAKRHGFGTREAFRLARQWHAGEITLSTPRAAAPPTQPAPAPDDNEQMELF